MVDIFRQHRPLHARRPDIRHGAADPFLAALKNFRKLRKLRLRGSAFEDLSPRMWPPSSYCMGVT